jgi:hypothetical protein
MTNPILKKLSKPGLQASEIAALLEKHIGDKSSEFICSQAFEAVARLKDERLVLVVYVTIRILDSKMTYAKKVQTIIDHLRTASEIVPSGCAEDLVKK